MENRKKTLPHCHRRLLSPFWHGGQIFLSQYLTNFLTCKMFLKFVLLCLFFMLVQSLWTCLFLWLLKFYFFLWSAVMGFVWCQYGIVYLCQGYASMKTDHFLDSDLHRVSSTGWISGSHRHWVSSLLQQWTFALGLVIWFEKLHCSSWRRIRPLSAWVSERIRGVGNES